jgi:hypothetical protein
MADHMDEKKFRKLFAEGAAQGPSGARRVHIILGNCAVCVEYSTTKYALTQNPQQISHIEHCCT